MEFHSKTDIKNSIYDGVFANIFATLTGGVFLTGFALYLGMSDAMIGMLGSIPFLVTAFQLPVSYFLGKNGGRKLFLIFLPKLNLCSSSAFSLFHIVVFPLAMFPGSHGSPIWFRTTSAENSLDQEI